MVKSAAFGNKPCNLHAVTQQKVKLDSPSGQLQSGFLEHVSHILTIHFDERRGLTPLAYFIVVPAGKWKDR